ncbi:MAG: AAA family ATPase [Candidatus Aminicenantes bacterium]|nr:MAG: AAA family ATPase [Candidatus Aminicenantes bacterium]
MKPVIVLTFANDRDRYLEMINRERKNIFKALRHYDDEEFIQVRKVESTSVEDIFELFSHYQDQVAIFHYGGHANGTHLQLETPGGESQLANALGLAQLMGQQKGLQLVFLNGCATLNQVELLLSVGVRAVIATSVVIDDKMAVEFAEQFYKKLAKQVTIQKAFETARAFITTRYGPSREIIMHRDLSWKKEKKAADKEVPWGLYVNESSPGVLDWKLPSTWDPIRSRGEKTLEDMLKHRKKIPIKDIINMAIQISELLEKNHHDGMVKKNITPKNIILDENNKVKSLRFGRGELKGTYFYISPQQAQGGGLELQDNIWSLGVVLYKIAAGQLPFKGKYKQAVIDTIINHSPPPLTEIRANIPKGLEKIILKCLCKNREYRYPSMPELLSDLKELVKSLEAENKPGVTPEPQDISGTRELRLVTVMCGEISGYNQMLEKSGTEETAATMKNCFKILSPVIEKFGGSRIGDKIIGSSFTAFFGLPTAIEDAPKKAVSAAIEMRDKLYQLREERELQIPLDIHIGIDTGKVIAQMGADENKDFSNVMGDAVIMASRLNELAADGEIYIGRLTQGYTSDEFDYKQLEPITLKGRIKPVSVFKFLSPKKKINRMIDSEMVGRDKELDQLKLHVLKVINGEGSIVSVIGEAGIGKSRLLDELKKTGEVKKVTMLEGKALSIGRNLSYFPIIDILKNWAKIKEEDSETRSLSKLEQTIANIHPRGVGEVFPFVATLMGMKLTGKYAARVKGIEGAAMEKLILKNMRELMIKIAERLPLVCFIHDIHWADLSSIELLESLFRLAEKHRILFILELRPNYKDTGERVLETIRERYGRFYLEIKLEPLDEKECEILIQNLVKVSGLPTGIMTAITNRTEGNPFFIEEVIRSFIDDGVIKIEHGKFKVTEKIDAVVIPETIQDALMSRIDRLDQATRTLLKEASVIGRYFFYKILTEVAKTIDHIDDKLEYLKGIQVLLERERLGESEYLFKHALARDVTYESILLKRRKELHLKVAETIESVFSVQLHEFYGMLALHYCKGENPDKAEEYLIKAGEEALKAAASREALNYYQEALKLYLSKSGHAADPEKIAMLEKNIGLAFFNKGHMVEAVEHFDKVLVYWGEKRPKNKFIALPELIINLLTLLKMLIHLPDKPGKVPGERDNEIINITEKRALALSSLDTYRMFIDTIRLARKLNKFDIENIENGISLLAAGSGLFCFTGISFKISKKMLDITKGRINKNDIKSVIVYRHSRVMHNVLSGNWMKMKEFEYDENLIDGNLARGEFFYTTTLTDWTGLLNIEVGNFARANEMVKKLDEIGETYDNDITRIRKYLLSAALLFKQRKLYDALNELDAGINLVVRTGQKNLAVFAFGMKPNIQILLEDIKGAEESLLQAKELVSHEKRIAPYYMSYLLISQFLFDLYRLEESVHSNDKTKISHWRKNAYQSGKAVLKNSKKHAVSRTKAFKLIGLYYWLIEKQRKAFAWWDKSIRIGEHLGARPELARTYMEVGKRLAEKKSKLRELKGIRGQEYLEKARVLFKEMELEKDLEELDKIKSQIEEGK